MHRVNAEKEEIDYAFEFAINLESTDAVAYALADLGPYLPQGLLEDAIDEAMSIDYADERVHALYGLVGHVMHIPVNSGKHSDFISGTHSDSIRATSYGMTDTGLKLLSHSDFELSTIDL